MALFAMNQIFKRGIQGVVKITADQIGNQKDSDQTFNELDQGYLKESYTTTRVNIEKESKQFLNDISYIFNDSVKTFSNMYSNLGFTEEN